jgi:hypothetical protein
MTLCIPLARTKFLVARKKGTGMCDLLKTAIVTYENFYDNNVLHSKSNTWSVIIEDCQE